MNGEKIHQDEDSELYISIVLEPEAVSETVWDTLPENPRTRHHLRLVVNRA